MARGGGVGPLVAHAEVGAEAARLVLEALDLRDGVVRRADHRDARGVERVDERAEVLRVRRDRKGGHPLEVVDPLLEAERDVGDRLLLGVGDVHRPDEAPLVAVDRRAELLGPLLHHLPVRTEHVEPALPSWPRVERRLQPKRPARRGAGGRDLGRHADLGEGALVGEQLQACLHQLEPLRLHGDRLAGEQLEDGLEALLHHVALLGRVDAHHEHVRRQRAGPDAEHHPAASEVIEQDHAVRQHERVVVRQ